MDLARMWKSVTRPARRPATAQLRLRALEDRTNPAPVLATYIAVGSGVGLNATVNCYTAEGTFLTSFNPYPGFQGGVNTSLGDINGDGVPDVITGPGFGGGPHVKVFNGADILNGSTNPTVLRDFFAPYGPAFIGGCTVAAGEVNADGLVDIITGAGPSGGPHVVIFSNGNQDQILSSFFPYGLNFTGGVNVAAGDFGGDQTTDEIVIGSGPGAATFVTIYKYNGDPNPNLSVARLAVIQPFDPIYTVGANVAAGYFTNNRDADGFGYADVVVSVAGNGGPQVSVYRLLDAIDGANGLPDWQYFLATSFYAFEPAFAGGVRVGSVFNGPGPGGNILAAAGPGGGPFVINFNGQTLTDLQTFNPTIRFGFFAFDANFTGGVFV
jgi:hypothetical protein